MNILHMLNATFGSEGIEFRESKSGLILCDITNSQGRASVSLQGAQVVSWVPADEQPVIWLSPEAQFEPGRSIRGGVPICWPWFGAHPDDPEFPAHGYARTSEWELIHAEHLEDGRTRLVLRLIESGKGEKYWPYMTELECHISVGKSLEIELVTRNEDAREITLSEALHTYFHVGDIRQVSVLGLEQAEYRDKLRGFEAFTQPGAIRFEDEVDRVYVNSKDAVVIDDPKLSRRIRIEKQGSHSTIVWNPWDEKSQQMGDMGEEGYQYMLCVESGNALEDAVILAPGEEHRLVVHYTVERALHSV
ncbi:MAG: D-hexose-6-phosphate mutarotase [Gammaproteobacteria bacterium]|nr:D-hexose-6-phosphate mutarotase [Gammaproteobacteria bacterium]